MHLGVLESNLSGSGFEGLRLAKERGLDVTFFTRDLQRYLDVPGAARYFRDYVDDLAFCETNDFDALVRQVEDVAARHPFDAFMTMGEYDVVLAARVGQLLGVPAPTAEAVAVARNKARMRARCAEHGVPMPRWCEVATVAEVRRAVAFVGLPCVVKPVDETSSVDVVRCTTQRQVEEHVLHILHKQVNTRGQKRMPTVLVEQCLEGYEVSVEVLGEGDRFHVLGVTDKSVAGQGHFVETAHVFPSLLPTAQVADCGAVAVSALRAVGFDLGLAHVELKVDERGPQLVEINPRPAGDNITELVDRSLGISCLDLMIRQYLGEPVLSTLVTGPRGGAAIRYLTATPGTITSIAGAEVAERNCGVVRVSLEASVGQVVAPLQRNGDRLGYVLAVADDPYTAARRAEAAGQAIVVTTVISPSRPARPVANGLADLIGGTPAVRLPVVGASRGTTVVAKLEMANPLSSVKDRTALCMLRAAEERGDLIPGKGTIIEATSGNTGIALAGLAAACGYQCVIVLPDSATVERVRLIRALGAEVVQTPSAAGYPGAIAEAEEIHRRTAGSWFPRQHENPDNIRAHYQTTGPELWADLEGRVDVFVCGVGTGGTLSGVARYLEERNPRLRVVAVEPEGSPLLSGGAGGLHAIPGFNGGFIAPTTDVGCIDEVITVADQDAASAARDLARDTGLFVGISSGAAAFASSEVARRPESAGQVIATIFPDGGERYLSTWDSAPADRHVVERLLLAPAAVGR
jgi:cysteine synthase